MISLTRAAYRGLLYLHPPAFREQFGDEMLWIFEESAGVEQNAAVLLADGAMSALRQWFIGYEVWKVVPLSAYWVALLVTLIDILKRGGIHP